MKYIALFLLTFISDFCHGQSMPVTNGKINAILVDVNTAYLGGQFSHVGEYAGSCLVFDVASGTRLGSFPRVNGTVHAAISDGAGGFYIGGQFSSVGGLVRNRVARIRADGSVDPLFDVNVELSHSYKWSDGTPVHPPSASVVYSLALDGEVLFMGGAFTHINGTQKRWGLAAVNAVTGIATTFNPMMEILDYGVFADVPGQIQCLLVQGQTIFVGGFFNRTNRHFPGGIKMRVSLAALDKISGSAHPWNPNATLDLRSYPLIPRAMTLRGSSELVVGGHTESGNGSNMIGGVSRLGGVARVDLASGTVAPWNPPVDRNYNSWVNAFITVGSSIYIGGSFSLFESSQNLWSVNMLNGAPVPWNPEIDDFFLNDWTSIDAMVRNGETIYTAGYGIGNAETGTARVALGVDVSTGKLSGNQPETEISPAFFRIGPVPLVRCLAISGGKMLAGGDFKVIDVKYRQNMAALDLRTGRFTDWKGSVTAISPDTAGPSPAAAVHALAKWGDLLIAGGEFELANPEYKSPWPDQPYLPWVAPGGTPRKNIAAFDLTTGAVAAFDPRVNGPVRALAADSNYVYAGGEFNLVNDTVPRNFLASFLPASGSVASWNPDPDDFVFALTTASDGSALYAGGLFTSFSAGNLSRSGIASFGGNGQLLAFDAKVKVNSAAQKGVLGLAVDGPTLYAVGSFNGGDAIGGNTRRNHAAAFDAISGAVYPWDPDLGGTASEIAVGINSVHVGGMFEKVNGASGPLRRFCAALNKSTGADAGPAPLPDPNAFRRGNVSAVASTGTAVLVGGEFGPWIIPPSNYTYGTPSGEAVPGLAVTTLKGGVTFNSWRETAGYFTAGELAARDPSIVGQLADPDGDGLVNLQEYAFGGHPRLGTLGASHLPKIIPTLPPSGAPVGGRYVALTFQRSKDAVDSGCTFTVENNVGPLDSWVPLTGALTVTETTGGLQTVKLDDPRPLVEGSRFYRVRVSAP